MPAKPSRSRERLATLKLTRNQCIQMLRACNLAVEHLQATAKPGEQSAVAMECADYVIGKELVVAAMKAAGMVRKAAQADETKTTSPRDDEEPTS